MFKILYAFIVILSVSCSHQVTFDYKYEYRRDPASLFKNCHSAFKRLVQKKSVPININQEFHTTLGVEFEGMMSSHLSFRDVGELLKSYLIKKDPESIYELEEKIYQTNGGGILRKIVVSTWKNGKEYTYTIKYDETLDPPLGKTGIEITSPILRQQSDFDDFIDALNFLQKNQVDEFPDGGGIHVHYGLQAKPSLKKTYELYGYMDQMHESLLKTFKVEKSRMDYLGRSDLRNMIERLRIKLIKDPGHEDIDVSYIEGLRSLIRFVPQYRTVEMRIFNSSMSKDHLSIYTDFVNRFFKAWEEGNADLIDYFKSNKNADVLEVSQIIGAKLELLRGH